MREDRISESSTFSGGGAAFCEEYCSLAAGFRSEPETRSQISAGRYVPVGFGQARVRVVARNMVFFGGSSNRTALARLIKTREEHYVSTTTI